MTSPREQAIRELRRMICQYPVPVACAHWDKYVHPQQEPKCEPCKSLMALLDALRPEEPPPPYRPATMAEPIHTCCYLGCKEPITRRYVDKQFNLLYLCDLHAQLLGYPPLKD